VLNHDEATLSNPLIASAKTLNMGGFVAPNMLKRPNQMKP
jgi:hypothetical protein